MPPAMQPPTSNMPQQMPPHMPQMPQMPQQMPPPMSAPMPPSTETDPPAMSAETSPPTQDLPPALIQDVPDTDVVDNSRKSIRAKKRRERKTLQQKREELLKK